jgi:hypothetical protein
MERPALQGLVQKTLENVSSCREIMVTEKPPRRNGTAPEEICLRRARILLAMPFSLCDLGGCDPWREISPGSCWKATGQECAACSKRQQIACLRAVCVESLQLKRSIRLAQRLSPAVQDGPRDPRHFL